MTNSSQLLEPFHLHGFTLTNRVVLAPMAFREFRQVFHGPLIDNCGYNQETAEAAIASTDADMIAIGRRFFSNPDLVARYQNNWPLNPDAEMPDWYSPTGANGYTDFPASH